MKYKNSRPDSPKGSVYTKFVADGGSAANEFGLGLKIPQSKLTRWFKEWSGNSTELKPVATPEPDDSPKRGTNRVYSMDDLSMTGTVVKRGDTQSEVKWDDPKPWGAVTVVTNASIRPVGTPAIDVNERAVFLNATHFAVLDFYKHGKPVKKGEKREPVPQYETFRDARRAAGGEKSRMVHAVTAAGNSVPIPRPLWQEYMKLEGQDA